MRTATLSIRRFLATAAIAGLPLAVTVGADDREGEYRSELARAQELLTSGKAKESIEVFDAANRMAGKKSSECFLGLSLAHLRLGEFEDAEKLANKAVEHAATSHEQAEGHYYLGSALMGQDEGDGKKISDALPELREAADIEPENAAFRYQLGLALLRVMDEAAGVPHLKRFLELAPGSPRADEVRGYIEYPLRAHPDYAPEFELVTESGREISLVNQRGRVLLLDFWATWCPPCVESVPWLKRLHEEYSDEPFTLLSVSVDQDEAAWTAFVQENDLTWEHHRDTGGVVPQFLPPRFAIPTYIVIDGGGVVRGVFHGDDWRSLRRLESTVKECLDELRPRSTDNEAGEAAADAVEEVAPLTSG